MLKISWCSLQDDSLHCSEWNVSLLQYFVMITKGIMSDHYQHLLIIYIYMHIYIYHTYICIYVYTYMNVCTYIFIIYTYVYLYIHVYIDQYLPIIYVYIYISFMLRNLSLWMKNEWWQILNCYAVLWLHISIFPTEICMYFQPLLDTQMYSKYIIF